PGAGNSTHIGLAAETALGPYFTRDARNFRSERIQLVHHRVDGVLKFEDFTFHVHRDLPGEVAVCNRGGYISDVAHLAGEVTGHRVHVVGQVFPRSGHATHISLAAEFSFTTYFTRHTRNFRSERVQLVDHRVDGVLEFEDFALDVDGDLLGKIAVRNRGGHVSDVAHLAGKIAGHEVHVVSQVLPGSGNADHLRLTAQPPFCSYLASDARNFRCKRAELIHHRVDSVLEFENLALHVDCDLLGKVTVRNRRGHFRDIADLAGKVA